MGGVRRLIAGLALAALVVQNTALILFQRYSRTMDSPRYLSSTAVAVMECVKFCTCLGVIFAQAPSPKAFVEEIRREVVTNRVEIVRLAIPSFLYTVQNNLLYYAL